MPEILTAIEWAPGENSIAVLTVSARRPDASDAAAPPRLKCAIKALDINSGAWNRLADVAIEPDAIEVLGLKTLSWTR